jgi:hypothetical protein
MIVDAEVGKLWYFIGLLTGLILVALSPTVSALCHFHVPFCMVLSSS